MNKIDTVKSYKFPSVQKVTISTENEFEVFEDDDFTVELNRKIGKLNFNHPNRNFSLDMIKDVLNVSIVDHQIRIQYTIFKKSKSKQLSKEKNEQIISELVLWLKQNVNLNQKVLFDLMNHKTKFIQLIYCNISGKGKAKSSFEIFKEQLDKCGQNQISHCTRNKMDAYKFILESRKQLELLSRSQDFIQFQTFSGDGVIHEVYNGLMKLDSDFDCNSLNLRPFLKNRELKPRSNSLDFNLTPHRNILSKVIICIVPCGSANTLYNNFFMNQYSELELFMKFCRNQSLTHNPAKIKFEDEQNQNVTSKYNIPQDKIIQSIVSVTYGTISEIDIESERQRWLGGLRFDFLGVIKSICPPKFDLKMSFENDSTDYHFNGNPKLQKKLNQSNLNLNEQELKSSKIFYISMVPKLTTKDVIDPELFKNQDKRLNVGVLNSSHYDHFMALLNFGSKKGINAKKKFHTFKTPKVKCQFTGQKDNQNKIIKKEMEKVDIESINQKINEDDLELQNEDIEIINFTPRKQRPNSMDSTNLFKQNNTDLIDIINGPKSPKLIDQSPAQKRPASIEEITLARSKSFKELDQVDMDSKTVKQFTLSLDGEAMFANKFTASMTQGKIRFIYDDSLKEELHRLII